MKGGGIPRWVAAWAGALALLLVGQGADAASQFASGSARGSVRSAVVVPEQGVHARGLHSTITPTVQIVTSSAQVLAAEWFTVTATSSIAATETYPITVIDFTLGTVLTTCTSGTTCMAYARFTSTERRQYIARHGETETSPVTVTPTPWNLTATATPSLVSAGQTFSVTLVTSQNPYTVRDVWGARIVDVGSGVALTECTSTTPVTGGYQCLTYVPWFADASRQYRGELYDKATGDVLATSNEAIVTSQPWVLSVSTGAQVLTPDGHTTLTVHSNQQVYSIRTQYIVHIINAATGTVVTTCDNLAPVSGDFTCSATVSTPAGSQAQFYAVVAPPTTPGVDRLATSNVASIVADAWVARLEVDKPVVAVTDEYVLTAYANGQPSSALPPGALYVVDQDTGAPVGNCATLTLGSSGEYYCRVYLHADPAVRTHRYAAVVASPSGPAVDVTATSNLVTVSPMAWALAFSASALASPGGSATFMAETNQSIYWTRGNYYLYLEDVATGAILATCTDTDYGSSQNTFTRCGGWRTFDQLLASQTVRGFVAPAGNPGGPRLAESESVTLSRAATAAYLGYGMTGDCWTSNPYLYFVGSTSLNVTYSSYHPILHASQGSTWAFSYGYSEWLMEPKPSTAILAAPITSPSTAFGMA